MRRRRVPPRYFLRDSDPEIQNRGSPGGQLMRYIPAEENQAAGRSWKGVCFAPHIAGLTTTDFKKLFNKGTDRSNTEDEGKYYRTSVTAVKVQIDVNPYWKFARFEHAANPPVEAGMWDNGCWPKKIAPKEPGFSLWSWDQWYDGTPGHTHEYDFTREYKPEDTSLWTGAAGRGVWADSGCCYWFQVGVVVASTKNGYF